MYGASGGTTQNEATGVGAGFQGASGWLGQTVRKQYLR